MLAQPSEQSKILPVAILSASMFLGVSTARAQAPELQGLPPGQFSSSPPGLIAGLGPASTGLPSVAAALPDKAAATPRIDPVLNQPPSRLQPAPPSPWITALLALAGLVGVGLAVIVLSLAVREMRREATERRRLRRRRVARRPGNSPELDARWLPRQRGLFDR